MIKIKYLKNTCPICASKNTYKFRNFLRKDIFPTNIGVTKFELKDELCIGCGLIFSNPVPSQKSLNSFYSNKFLNKFLNPDYNIKNQIRFIKKNFNTDNKILEIGSSNNFLVKELKSYGYRVHGYDLSNKSNLVMGKFDVVLFNHVLEHTSKPFEFLKSLKSLCKSNGFFIIEVPNSENYLKTETSVLTCEHNYHFNKYNLIKFLEKIGFKFKFHEKKLISRKSSLRLVFQNHLINSNNDFKKSFFSNNLDKKKIKNIKSIYTLMLNKRKNINLSLKKKYKKLENISSRNKTKFIYWGANIVFLNCYLNFSRKISKNFKLVDINYLKIKYLKLDNKKINVENPSKYISKSNIFFICSLSWYKDIKKYLIKLKVPKKNIYPAY